METNNYISYEKLQYHFTLAPSCLTDESLGVHNYVTTKSNMKFHYVAKGQLGKPLLLCVHGFPEVCFVFDIC